MHDERGGESVSADPVKERLQEVLGEGHRIERELGGGGMSRVFLATDTEVGRPVVVKLLAPELTSDVMVARFRRELEVTGQLQHPHILPVLVTGARNGLLYYITPYVAGESLRRRLEREGPIPIADAVRVLHEVADALAFAHARGVVHRDIKPENILLSEGHAVLADFGIARVIAGAREGLTAERKESDRLTELGTSLGTMGYIAPEQAAGETTIDARADIYALGIVGYEMLAGSPPFAGKTASQLLVAHMTEVPKSVREIRADTPLSVSMALDRALAKAPDDRFQSAAEFRDALGFGLTATHAAHPLPRTRPWSRLAASAVAMAALAAAAVYAYSRANRESTLDPNLVAVAPFEVLSPELAVWREGMVDVLSANLDGAGPIRTVSPTVVVRRWDGRADAASAAELGQRTGARHAVFGRIVKSGTDSVRLAASVVDAASGRPIGDVELRQAISRMDQLADSLTLRVLGELGRTRDLALVRRASIGSSSLAAIKSFLQAEQYFRRTQWDSAGFYYARAIAEDSTFAPALRGLSNVLDWKLVEGVKGTSTSYALLARTHNRGLSPRESLLVAADAQWKSLDGRTLGSFRAGIRQLFATLDSAVRRFPDDPEIWFKLGDVRYHFHSVIPGESYTRSREAFDRSIALDSAFAPSYIHTIDLALRAQDVGAARNYIRRYQALNSTDLNATTIGALGALLATDRASGVDSIVHALPRDALQLVFEQLTNLMDSSETALRVMRAIARGSAGESPDPARAARRRATLAITLATRGHLREAYALYDSTQSFMLPDFARFGVVPEDRAAAEMSRWLADTVPWRPLAAMSWWADRGDTASVRRGLRHVQAMRMPRGVYSAQVVAAAEGYLALARRDTTAALLHFAAVPDSLCFAGRCDRQRFTEARLLAARGSHEAAAALLAKEYVGLGPGRVLWMLERAQAAERVDKRQTAAAAYAYVVNAWTHADAELQGLVAEARAGLERTR